MSANPYFEPKPLKRVFEELISRQGWDLKIKEHDIPDVWQEIVGDMIAKVTKVKKVEKGKLYIETVSSTWRAELMLRREMLIEKINDKIGS
ncbi:MAG: DUF721 domain-containing protein, partial [FCB group bacterium]